MSIQRTDFDKSVKTMAKYVRQPIDRLLVLGAGRLDHERFFKANVTVAIEWADDRLAVLRELEGVVPIKYDFARVGDLFPPGTFDTAILFDAIEHLPKEDALAVLDYLKKNIKKQILMFIPIQPPIEDVEAVIKSQKARMRDNLELGHHLSTWTASEMESLGFSGEVSPDYHKDKGWGAMVCYLDLDGQG